MAIIIRNLDKPDNCLDCPFAYFGVTGSFYCMLTDEKDICADHIPDFCTIEKVEENTNSLKAHLNIVISTRPSNMFALITRA